jgi:3-oxoacyl-[acyl-carrier protein] reductase
MLQLQNKVAIVTGAGSGFGKATVQRFVAEGAFVVACDVSEESVRDLAGLLGERCAPFRADVRDFAAVEATVAFAEDSFGGLDIMVNNAGVVNDFTDLAETTEREFDRMFDINTKGTYFGIKAAVPALRRRGGGVILNTASVGGIAPRAGHVIYAATKSAVITLTRGLVSELSPDIRINCILPSAADTNFLLDAGKSPEAYRDVFEQAVAALPLKRACRPEDVAAAFTFLASDEAAYITGVALPVDGGRSAAA